jgi:N-acetylmuramic acid 6-phosphate etherase
MVDPEILLSEHGSSSAILSTDDPHPGDRMTDETKSITEQANPRTKDIDLLKSRSIVRLINDEDRNVAEAVYRALDRIADAVDLAVDRLSAGGHLFYIGSGTSGRLGVLDASECPPTFGVSPDLVRGIIAGGPAALTMAIEGAEDDHEQGARDLEAAGTAKKDVVVALSASGNTPYTLGAVQFAKQIGAGTVSVTCNPRSKLATAADLNIVVMVGPEVIAGSSRMKAGTAQKMVLNMISTATMIRMGLVYSNLMSNLVATNEKLRRRAVEIISTESQLSVEKSGELFETAGHDLRVALAMIRLKIPREKAESLLQEHGGSLRRVLDE